MSLINDALKRAQEVQTTSAPGPAAPGPELRPADPAQTALRGAGLVVPAALAMIALLVLFMVWQAVQRTNTPANNPDSPTEVRAKEQLPQPARVLTRSVSKPVAGVPPRPVAPMPRSKAKPLPPQMISTPGPAAPQQLLETQVSVETLPAPTPAPTSVSPTNTVEAAPAAPAPPPPARVFKLQSIVLGARPSAMINGRIVAIGDAFNEFRVRRITADSVTLISSNHQRVLVLGD